MFPFASVLMRKASQVKEYVLPATMYPPSDVC
jgi:hypothetical protein